MKKEPPTLKQTPGINSSRLEFFPFVEGRKPTPAYTIIVNRDITLWERPESVCKWRQRGKDKKVFPAN